MKNKKFLFGVLIFLLCLSVLTSCNNAASGGNGSTEKLKMPEMSDIAGYWEITQEFTFTNGLGLEGWVYNINADGTYIAYGSDYVENPSSTYSGTWKLENYKATFMTDNGTNTLIIAHYCLVKLKTVSKVEKLQKKW